MNLKKIAAVGVGVALAAVPAYIGSVEAAPGGSSIFSSTAFLDYNGNNVHDAGEPAIVGNTTFSWIGVSDNNSALDGQRRRIGNEVGANQWGGPRPDLAPEQEQDCGLLRSVRL